MRCTLIVTGAPLAARAADLVSCLREAAFSVDYIATLAATEWLDQDRLTDLAVVPRASSTQSAGSRLPLPDVAIVCPATFNTINKMAAGIADTHAHSFLAELLGAGTRLLVVPMINDRLWGNPALKRSLELLRSVPTCLLVDPRSLDEHLRPIRSGTGRHVVAGFDVAGLVSRLT